MSKPTYQRDAFDILTLDPARAEVLLGDWYFREDKYGDVRSWTEDGRRTPLKRAKGSPPHSSTRRTTRSTAAGSAPPGPTASTPSTVRRATSIEVCVREARLERQRSLARLWRPVLAQLRKTYEPGSTKKTRVSTAQLWADYRRLRHDLRPSPSPRQRATNNVVQRLNAGAISSAARPPPGRRGR